VEDFHFQTGASVHDQFTGFNLQHLHNAWDTLFLPCLLRFGYFTLSSVFVNLVEMTKTTHYKYSLQQSCNMPSVTVIRAAYQIIFDLRPLIW